MNMNRKTERGMTDFQKKSVAESAGVFGCYVLSDDGITLYVGKSFNVGQRLTTHFCGEYSSFCGMVSVFDLTKIASDMNHVEAREYLSYYERALIRKLNPINNKKAKKSSMSWSEFSSLSTKVQRAIINRTESILTEQ